MNEERLETLLVLSIEHDLINTIDSDIIIDKFSNSILLAKLDHYLYSNR